MGGKRMIVWVLEKGKPAPRMLKPGIQDSRFVEVEQSKLNEGEEVIVGMNTTEGAAPATRQNPFAPQMPGGRGRRGGI